MWSLRWHFTNKSVAGAPYSIKVCRQWVDWDGHVHPTFVRGCSWDCLEKGHPSPHPTVHCPPHFVGPGDASGCGHYYVSWLIIFMLTVSWMTYHWHSNQHHDDTGNSTATGNIRNYSCDDATLTHKQHICIMYSMSQQRGQNILPDNFATTFLTSFKYKTDKIPCLPEN